MIFEKADFRQAQRWCVLGTIVLVELAVWLNALDSGIAKAPLLILGSTLLVALFLAGVLITGRMADVSLPGVSLLILLHIPLFTLSALLSYDPVYTWSALSFGLCCIVLFFAGAMLYPARKDVALLLDGVLWVTALLCAVGVIQFFFADKLPLNFFLGAENRVTSLLGNSNYFASYLIIVFPLVLSIAIQKHTSNKNAALHFLLLAVILFLLMITQARSSIAGWIVSFLVFLVLTSNAGSVRKAALVAGLVLAGVIVFTFAINPDLGHRFTTMFDWGRRSTFARRIQFWTAGLKAFLASPWWGHGIGTFEKTVWAYRSPEYWKVGSEDIVPHAHNEVLEIAEEYGILGLALFIAVFTWILRQGISLVRNAKGWERWTAAGITSSIIAISVDNLANVTLREAPVAMLAWLLAGLLFSKALTKMPEKSIPVPVRIPAVSFVIPFVAWAVFAGVYAAGTKKEIDSDVHLLRAILQKADQPLRIVEAQAAIEKNPLSLLARSNLAYQNLVAGRWEDAVNSVNALQKLAPLYPKSFLVKAFALLELKRYPEALESARQELQLRAHPEAYRVQASAYRALGDEQMERQATRNVLQNDIDGNINYMYRSFCKRLLELSRTDAERKEAMDLLGSLENMTQDHEFFAQLKEQANPGH